MKPVELLTEAVTVLYEKINDAVGSLHSKLKKEQRENEIQIGDGQGSSRGTSPMGTPNTAPRYARKKPWDPRVRHTTPPLLPSPNSPAYSGVSGLTGMPDAASSIPASGYTETEMSDGSIPWN